MQACETDSNDTKDFTNNINTFKNNKQYYNIFIFIIQIYTYLKIFNILSELSKHIKEWVINIKVIHHLY